MPDAREAEVINPALKDRKMAKRKCPRCNGKGVIPCPMDYGDDDERHPSSCPGCGGDPKARVECPDCEGTGKIDD